jgi:hypothetical protein
MPRQANARGDVRSIQPAFCLLNRTDLYSVPIGTRKLFEFNNAFRDPFNMWSAADPGKINIPTTGLYIAHFTTEWVTKDSLVTLRCFIRLNGSTYIAADTKLDRSIFNGTVCIASVIKEFARGDYLECLAEHNDVAAYDLRNGATHAVVNRIGRVT